MKPRGSKKELVTGSDYEGQSTVRQPTDAANIKTQDAMKLRDQLDAADPKKVIPPDLEEKVRPENAADRMIKARDQAIEARQAEGKSVTNLEKVTNEKAYETTHNQLGDIHQQRQNDPVPSSLKKATKSDINKALNSLDDGTARSGPFIKGGPRGGGPVTLHGMGPDLAQAGIDIFKNKQDEMVERFMKKSYYSLTAEEKEFMDYAGYEWSVISDQWKPDPDYEMVGMREMMIVVLTLKKTGRYGGDWVRSVFGISGGTPLMFRAD